MIVGKYLGKLHLGAIDATSSISAIIHSFSMGLSVGVKFFRVKENKEVKNTFSNSYYTVGL